MVLVYDLNRLSRKLYYQMILAKEFEKQGIKLGSITQDMSTSPEDRMFFNMRGLVAGDSPRLRHQPLQCQRY